MNDVVKVTKSGWLKKQGGLVRNWQDKWFVLKDQSLFYYSKEDESRQQGVISLHGSKITEIPFNRDEPEKWLLEISREKSNYSNETHVLCANSEAQRVEWTSSLRRAIYGFIGGGVFGGPLVDVIRYDKAHYGCEVPHIVKHCVELILEHGKEVEGIFRLSGRLALVKEMRKKYDEGQRPILNLQTIDVHSSASLLKLYFRELPEPVIPFEHFHSFLSLATSFKHNSKPERTLQDLKSFTHQIPAENYRLLDYLTSFLFEISKYQDVNKMTEKNIATIFGTNILREFDSTPENQMATQNLTTHVVLALVKWHDVIFSDSANIGENVRVSEADFAKIVSISEEAVAMVDQPNGAQTADLLGIDFTADHVFSEEPKSRVPPPIPSRSFEQNDSQDIGLNLTTGSVEDSVTPATSLMNNPDPPVQRRVTSIRNKGRPAAIVNTNVSPLPSPLQEVRKSATLLMTKVDRQPSNFTSFIDSPLNSRVSLNIGDLPDSVEDLQALVLSLKLQLKEKTKYITVLEESNTALEVRIRQHLVELNNEKQAKDDAVAKVVTLSQELVAYKSLQD